MRETVMQQTFDAPLGVVFGSLAQHATYNTVLWPMRSVRIKDAADPEQPDGVGSTRRMGVGLIQPIRETITRLEPGSLIEYRMEKNPFFSHHFGQLLFSESEGQTQVQYRIELEGRLPLMADMALLQLQWSARRGLRTLARQLSSA